MEQFNQLGNDYSKYWVPILWCYSLLYEARMSGKIMSDVMLNNIIEV